MSLNKIESLADARKSEISREPLRVMTTATLFLLVLFLAHPARKSLREAAKLPSKRNVKYRSISYDSSPYSLFFSVPTSFIKHSPTNYLR